MHFGVWTGRSSISKEISFIVTRMFQRGKLDDIFTIVALYGQETTSSILEKNKYLMEELLLQLKSWLKAEK